MMTRWSEREKRIWRMDSIIFKLCMTCGVSLAEWDLHSLEYIGFKVGITYILNAAKIYSCGISISNMVH